MPDQIRNVFISHIHEDDEGIGKLKRLLSNTGLQIRDASISADKPNRATSDDYIKSQILAPHIRWASAVIVYITPQTRNSPWVDWEITYAQKQGKRIIGVWARGAKDADLPEALGKYHDVLVGWNSDRVVGAITGDIDESTTPSGELRPMRLIARYDCGPNR